MRSRPIEVMRKIVSNGGKNHARAKLGNAVIRCVKKPPVCLIAKLGNLAGYIITVIFKDCVKDAAHIFNHDSTGANFVNKPYSRRKQIALVGLSKLLAGFGERRAGQAAGEKINSFERSPVKGFQIFLKDPPVSAIEAERFAALMVVLNKPLMIEAGLLKPERLTAAAGAHL